MGVIGFQDFWVAGSRFYFQPDPIAAVEQPWIDLGIIQPANPSLAVEKVQLFDSDGGRKILADETTIGLTESYDIVCSNLNPDNRALLFLSNAPATFTQTGQEKTVTHFCHPGRLLKIKDSDVDATGLFSLDQISAVYTGTVLTKAIHTAGVVINKAARTILLTGDQMAVAGLATGKVIFVNRTGLANVKNAKSYTVVSKSLSTNTTVTVLEEPEADETALVGATITHENAGTIYKPAGIDWDVYSLSRGFLRFVSTGAFVAAANLSIVFQLGALSGKRLIQPQSLKGEIKGKGLIIWGRSGNAEQSMREAKVSITPSSSSIGDGEYSNVTLSVSVLGEITKTIPAGRMLDFAGSLPATS